MIDLKGSGFRLLTPTKKRSALVMATSGHTKRGKTTFALSMPAPLAVISTDPGTLKILEDHRRNGRQVIDCHIGLRKGTSKADHQKLWDQFRTSFDWAVSNTAIRSLVIDTATDMYSLVRLAKFGKLTQVLSHNYVEVNRELDELILSCFSRPINVAFLHTLKKQYETKKVRNKEGMMVDKDDWNGKWEVSGYSRMPYHVDLNLEHDYRAGEGFLIKFSEVPRYNAELFGTELPGMSFPDLASIVLPDADPEDWQDS